MAKSTNATVPDYLAKKGVMPGMDSSYYLTVAKLVDDGFQAEAARSSAHYGALLATIGATGQMVMQGLNNAAAYRLERDRMLFERDMKLQELRLAEQDLDIKRTQAEGQAVLQGIQAQKAVFELSQARYESSLFPARQEADLEYQDALIKLNPVLGRTLGKPPTQQDELELRDAKTALDNAMARLATSHGLTSAHSAQYAELSQQIDQRLTVSVGGVPFSTDQFRQRVQWAGTSASHAEFITSVAKDPSLQARLDADGRQYFDQWVTVLTSGNAGGPNVDPGIRYRWDRMPDSERLTMQVAYLRSTSPAFDEGWRVALSEKLRGRDAFDRAADFAGMAQAPTGVSVPSVASGGATGDGGYKYTLSDGTVVEAATEFGARGLIQAHQDAARQQSERVIPSVGDIRSMLPPAADPRFPASSEGKAFALAIETGTTPEYFFENAVRRRTLGAKDWGDPGGFGYNVGRIAGLGVPDLFNVTARSTMSAVKSDAEKQALAGTWASQFVLAASGSKRPEEMVAYLNYLKDTRSHLPTELQPFFAVGSTYNPSYTVLLQRLQNSDSATLRGFVPTLQAVAPMTAPPLKFTPGVSAAGAAAPMAAPVNVQGAAGGMPSTAPTKPMGAPPP